jgi:hypothetical protein
VTPNGMKRHNYESDSELLLFGIIRIIRAHIGLNTEGIILSTAKRKIFIFSLYFFCLLLSFSRETLFFKKRQFFLLLIICSRFFLPLKKNEKQRWK